MSFCRAVDRSPNVIAPVRFSLSAVMELALMVLVFTVIGLTARAYHRIIKTARTIADLEGEEKIRERHLKEAVGYRVVDERYWQRQEVRL